ncbi:hypothetical protein [Streptomyces sp. NBC_01363]|uniref:hypothetical protein n=1 Tax=Streptomyces sp. NBC_01363 TaxID=2903840 RepID=UPI00224DA539|nr:hypothetical protein [Streptomyces sp. NBC_01363]MCX4735361.1 hypothetical protein [Streptomyces sp. NBC_01363]
MQVSTLSLWGAWAFGVVIGWIAYRTLRRTTDGPRIADLVTVIAALGGGTVVSTQFAEPDLFAMYGIGLMVGFFAYLITGSLVDRAARKADQRALIQTPVPQQGQEPQLPRTPGEPTPPPTGAPAPQAPAPVPQITAGPRTGRWMGDKPERRGR